MFVSFISDASIFLMILGKNANFTLYAYKMQPNGNKKNGQ